MVERGSWGATVSVFRGPTASGMERVVASSPHVNRIHVQGFEHRYLQTVDIPLHALPLCLARREQISYVALESSCQHSTFRGRQKRGRIYPRLTDQVCHFLVPFELVAGEATRFGAGTGIFDAPRAPEDGSVER